MDARSLRRMTLGHRVITGGSHAPTPSYPQPQPSPPPRRRAPASPSEVQGLQAQDLGSGPLVAVAGRRGPDHLVVRRLPTPPRRPLRRDGAQGPLGHTARLLPRQPSSTPGPMDELLSRLVWPGGSVRKLVAGVIQAKGRSQAPKSKRTSPWSSFSRASNGLPDWDSKPLSFGLRP